MCGRVRNITTVFKTRSDILQKVLTLIVAGVVLVAAAGASYFVSPSLFQGLLTSRPVYNARIESVSDNFEVRITNGQMYTDGLYTDGSAYYDIIIDSKLKDLNSAFSDGKPCWSVHTGLDGKIWDSFEKSLEATSLPSDYIVNLFAPRGQACTKFENTPGPMYTGFFHPVDFVALNSYLGHFSVKFAPGLYTDARTFLGVAKDAYQNSTVTSGRVLYFVKFVPSKTPKGEEILSFTFNIVTPVYGGVQFKSDLYNATCYRILYTGSKPRMKCDLTEI